MPLADLEQFFYLDDADRKLVAGQREDHNRLGFSVQLATVRYIGRFLADPLEGVPAEVIDFLAGQLQIADPSCVKRYAQRQQTHREHAGKIRETLGLKDFAEVEARAGGVHGQAGVGDRGRPEGDLRRRGGVAAGTGCAAARGVPAGPSGGAGTGRGDAASQGCEYNDPAADSFAH